MAQSSLALDETPKTLALVLQENTHFLHDTSFDSLLYKKGRQNWLWFPVSSPALTTQVRDLDLSYLCAVTQSARL